MDGLLYFDLSSPYSILRRLFGFANINPSVLFIIYGFIVNINLSVLFIIYGLIVNINLSIYNALAVYLI